MSVEAEHERLIEPLKGYEYAVILKQLHEVLRPKSYLEIGARSGRTVQLAQCDTIAVDPVLGLRPTFLGSKPSCLLYQMESDKFFGDYDPIVLLGRSIDLAFLDGMHLAEFMLRDFMNTERHCARNSVIAIRDCVPTDHAMTRRREFVSPDQQSRNAPALWLGDVWKVVPILKKYRPDLKIYVVDSEPSGLALISNLNPGSTVLSDAYAAILSEMNAMGLDALRSYTSKLQLIPASEFATFETMSRYFYF